MDVEIDDQLLTQIAEKTGGRYFRATNNEKLREIYNEIDKLEKTRLFSMEYQAEPDLYAPFALGALLLLAAELLLRFTFLSPVT
jgi:Ca-activated chloride channel family protein